MVSQVIVSAAAGAGVVTVSRRLRGHPAVRILEEPASHDLTGAISRISRALRIDHPPLRELVDLKVFDGLDLHILKPLQLRYWTATAALNDAEEIGRAILAAGAGRPQTPRGVG
jgi:hypothetical protein